MHYIIEFVDTATSQEIDSYLVAHNMTEETAFAHFTSVRVVACDHVPKVDTLVTSVVLDNAPSVKLLEYTQDFTSSFPVVDIEVQDAKNWWKMASIKTPNYDAKIEHHQRRGTGAVVYVLDSGIESKHPEFVNADITLLHSFTGEFTDTRGHGTALASLIVGNTCGLTNASLKVVKIFDKVIATKQSDLLAAFDAVMVDFKANGKPAVVNLSWNIAKNQYLEDKLMQMIKQGIYIVAASGNDGQAITDVTPASVPLALTIGSYDQEFIPSNFSNYTGSSAVSYTAGSTNGGELDGWAPGEQIYAALLNGQYGMIAGTSASAAIHSGALAYNMDHVLDADGQFGKADFQSTTTTVGASYLSLARVGMMNLVGSYAKSANSITTYFTHQNDRPQTMGGRGLYIVGNEASLKLFDVLNVKRISYDTPLPSGLYISSGYLKGIPNDINTDFTITNIDIVLIKHDDTTTDFKLSIVLTKPEFDVYNQPTSDPDIQFILALPYCCGRVNNSCFQGNACFQLCENISNDKNSADCSCTDIYNVDQCY